MKKLFLLFPILLLSACVGKYMPKSFEFYGYDLRKYVDKGFQFIPDTYTGNYDNLGFVSAESFPEVGFNDNREFVSLNRITLSESIDSLYNFSVKCGANAIMKFQIENAQKENGSYVIKGIKISGFMIKKK